jgi:hypothetical protein
MLDFISSPAEACLAHISHNFEERTTMANLDTDADSSIGRKRTIEEQGTSGSRDPDSAAYGAEVARRRLAQRLSPSDYERPVGGKLETEASKYPQSREVHNPSKEDVLSKYAGRRYASVACQQYQPQSYHYQDSKNTNPPPGYFLASDGRYHPHAAKQQAIENPPNGPLSNSAYGKPTQSISTKPSMLTFRWWVPRESIRTDVIQADIQRYLGQDALVKPGLGTGENAVIFPPL